MKPFVMLKFPMMLVGFGAALLLSPACKAQEVSPDHFTDTGVQNVYEIASAKPATPKATLKPQATQARTHQAGSQAILQPVAKRTPASATQFAPKAAADKRKPVPPAPKEQ
jgi:hypothetical protein